MKSIIYIILNIFTHEVILQNLCSHKTCNECIRDVSKCVWCAMEVFNGSRCLPESMLVSGWCLNNTVNPTSESIVIEDRSFSSERDNVVQLKPQKTDIYIRAGASVNFDFSFKSAKDYPVDLYFLFDASKTMKNIKSSTMAQSERIYESMRTMTRNVYLGMGSFVDKNALPFTLILNSTLVYSFKNRLPLTDDVNLFQSTVANTPFGVNFDEQEGTLDALAQVITCKKEIGWRNESRKIIVLITDSSFHTAGDGKVAGIFKPYDGKCYIENGKYKNEVEMDYPSISMIRRLAAENEISVIFAVNLASLPVYTTLSEYIKGSRVASYEQNTIEYIVKDIYQEINRRINIKVNVKSEHAKFLRVSFNPDCQNSANFKCIAKQNEAKAINITGTIELSKYFDSDDNIQVDVIIEGIKEQLTLNLNVIKNCNCTNELQSPSCSNKGTRRCGICECDSDRYGLKCECIASKLVDNYDTSLCIAPNTSSICNNNPRLCKCGVCSCSEGLEGAYCQCGPMSCKKKCRDNEYCNCGTCACKEGWTGESCSCTESKTECIEGGLECNNRGKCLCGACKCFDIPKWDARRGHNGKCIVIPDQDQKTCNSRQCLILEDCALCYLNQDICPQCDKSIFVNKLSNLTLENFKEFPNECQLRARVGCYTKFLYRYNDGILNNIEVLLQTDLDCAESYYVTGSVCAVVLIIIGIVTMVVWKYVVDKHDRAELKKLYDNLQAHDDELCSNPIYAPATKTFWNPAFKKSIRAD